MPEGSTMSNNVWSKLLFMLSKSLLNWGVAKSGVTEVLPVVTAVEDAMEAELFPPTHLNGVPTSYSMAQDQQPQGGTDEKPAEDSRKPSG